MSATTTDVMDADSLTSALRSLASPRGAISMLALDHRDAMRNAYRRVGIEEVDEATMADAKARVIDVLGARCSAVLLDAPSVSRCRREGAGLLVPLEAQGHVAMDGGRLTSLLEDFGPADAARLGADGCKLLLYYRSDHHATAARQLELVRTVAAECHRHGLALTVEPLAYRLRDEDEGRFAAAFGELVVAGARDLARAGADLLKVQYPGSETACGMVSEAVRPLHWTLLGGSDVDGETFASQLRVACDAGACGFIAGRAIWGGALVLPAERQTAWLEEHARPLFERLATITDTYARRIA
jgi:tagatose 1,6-diphosphate aldolase